LPKFFATVRTSVAFVTAEGETPLRSKATTGRLGPELRRMRLSFAPSFVLTERWRRKLSATAAIVVDVGAGAVGVGVGVGVGV
jgi:hypothetical protein